MITTFDSVSFISSLVALSPRQAEREQQASRLICDTLQQYGIAYGQQQFSTTVPADEEAELVADGKPVRCKNTSLVGGTVEGVENLHSSLIPSRHLLEVPNINFNPRARSISRSNYYFAPSVAIAAADVTRLINARTVVATSRVRRHTYDSANILVGNTRNPAAILIAHYDSIEAGATDNAAGVACLLDLAIRVPEVLGKVLLVFSGNEELSYDQPTYWGHGFREFEAAFMPQLSQAESIIIVDVVGNGAPVLQRNDALAYFAFPVASLSAWQEKILLCYADVQQLMTVYHSADDTVAQITAEAMEQTHALLRDYLLT